MRSEYKRQAILHAGVRMQNIKQALTRDPSGRYPADTYEWLDEINLPPPRDSWQEMSDKARRYLLLNCVDDIAFLNRHDRKRAINSFLTEDREEQPMPDGKKIGEGILTEMLKKGLEELQQAVIQTPEPPQSSYQTALDTTAQATPVIESKGRTR